MNMKAIAGLGLTAGAVLVGFAVGFGVGQKTREATASNVTTEYKDGTVTIQADIATAVKTGVMDYLTSL